MAQSHNPSQRLTDQKLDSFQMPYFQKIPNTIWQGLEEIFARISSGKFPL